MPKVTLKNFQSVNIFGALQNSTQRRLNGKHQLHYRRISHKLQEVAEDVQDQRLEIINKYAETETQESMGGEQQEVPKEEDGEIVWLEEDSEEKANEEIQEMLEEEEKIDIPYLLTDEHFDGIELTAEETEFLMLLHEDEVDNG